MTGFQTLLDASSAFLDAADPETVTIAGFPAPVEANVGQIYRRQEMTENGYRWIERGSLEIRHTVLAALPRDVPPPKSHTDITVRGRTYRVDYTLGDTTTLRIAFSTFV